MIAALDPVRMLSMNRRTGRLCGSFLVVSGVGLGLLVVTAAYAAGPHAGHAAAHPPHIPAPRPFKMPTYHPPKMPHAVAPARANVNTVMRNHNKTANMNAARVSGTKGRTGRSATTARRSTKNSANTNVVANTGAGTGTRTHTGTYTYGHGQGSRRYRAYGYGYGYRNRSYGRSYGYGRSQGYDRSIAYRLRSVHSNLARVDHDYQGHRVRAMHSIAMAVRQLTHRSMVYSGVGFAPGQNMNMNNAMAMRTMRQNGANGLNGANGVNGVAANGLGARAGLNAGNGVGAGAGGRHRMPQAQSDARISRAVRTLNGINMQLANRSNVTTGHARASGHIHHAIYELNTALAVR